VAVALGLLLSLGGMQPAGAKAKAKAKKKTTKKAAATTKKTTATTAKASGATQSKGTIRIGVLGNEISRGAPIPPEAKDMASVYQDLINAQGGINGYKVEVIYKSVQGDPARALAAIKELDKAGILAFTQGDASILPALRDYMTDKKIPVIAGTPYTNEFDWHPMFFHFSGQSVGVYGQVAAARDVGAKYFENFYCIEVAACATSVAETKYAADREGLKFRAEAGSLLGGVDYTAACLSAKNAGVDFFQANGPGLVGIVRDCARQNYHPTYAQGGAANQTVIDAAKGENVAGNLYEFGVFYDGPEVARFRAALAKTHQSVADGTASQTSVHVWLGLEMMSAAIKRITAANPTRDDFLEAMYSMKNDTLGGQIPPTDFSVQRPGTGKHASSDCWTEHIVKDGKLYHINTSGQIVNKLAFICGTGFKFNDQKSPM